MKQLTRIVVLLVMAASMLFSGTALAEGNANVCPEPKIDATTDGELNDIVPPQGFEFCVKGSTDVVTGVGDGETTLFEHLGNGHDVSHYGPPIEWSCEDPEWTDAPFCRGDSEPTETPEPEPTVDPTEPDADCTMDERSARGYCPDETEGHVEELCSLGIHVEGYPCDTPTEQPEPQEPGDGGEQPSEPDTVVTELPATGPANVALLAVLGLCMLGAGAWITRKYGWMN